MRVYRLSLTLLFKEIIEMKKSFFLLIILSAFSAQVIGQEVLTAKWSKRNAKKWYKKREWLAGVPLTPNKPLDFREFARQYRLNQATWEKAFAFLKSQDLHKIAKGKYPIDGDNVFASVTEDPSKDFDKTNWESHRKYIDVQCIIEGVENMGVCPISKATVTKEYDEKKDVANYSAKGKIYTGQPGTFFIFFPGDAHRPNITPGGNKVVKKVVVKVKVVP
jgi:biofilm protein TabA